MIKTPKVALGELFGNTEYIKQINISDTISYSKFKMFKPYSDEKLENLVEDIKTNGVLSPIIVRHISKDGYDLYEILAGHNRCAASKLAGLEKIPAIIKDDISDADADLIFVNTNLNQRDELLPSEKAFAYKLQI